MDLELHLERDEQAQLAATVATPGFKVVNKIMQHICDKFITKLINTPNHETGEVVSRHGLMQSAAQYHTMVANKINEVVQDYVLDRKTGPIVDPTEGLLDLGDIDLSQTERFVEQEDVNLLEER